MKAPTIIVAASIAAATCCGPAFAQGTQNLTVSKVVKYCVDFVNSPDGGHFDAFYNPATGMVENNVQTAGEQERLYRFDKCMAEQGYPLSH